MLEFSFLAPSPIIYHHFRPWHPFVPFTGIGQEGGLFRKAKDIEE
jgi:hypothetical protein